MMTKGLKTGPRTLLKKALKFSPWPLTRNMAYDRLTRRIVKEYCSPDSNCIDIGAHEGEIADLFLRFAPKGHHEAFEPIPEYYRFLQSKYEGRPVAVHPYALSDKRGKQRFHHVVSNPAYSGLEARELDGKEEVTDWIEVETATLDEVIAPDKRVDLVKVDVEGGEYHALKGGIKTLEKGKPLVIFEHGKGGADHYGISPGDLFDLLYGIGYELHVLRGFFGNSKALTRQRFTEVFEKGADWYFLAIGKE